MTRRRAAGAARRRTASRGCPAPPGIVVLRRGRLRWRQFFPFLDKWPAEWVVPVRDWVTDFFAWFAAIAKPVTRAIAWLSGAAAGTSSKPCSFAAFWPGNGRPCRGSRSSAARPSSAIGSAAAARDLLCGLCSFYLAIFGLWPDAMQTLSLVIVTVPLRGVLRPRARHLGDAQCPRRDAFSMPSSTCCRRRRIWPISAQSSSCSASARSRPCWRPSALPCRPWRAAPSSASAPCPSDIRRGGPDGGLHAAPAAVESRATGGPADLAPRPQSGRDADARHGRHRLARRRLGPRPKTALLAAAIADRQGGRAGHRHHASSPSCSTA